MITRGRQLEQTTLGNKSIGKGPLPVFPLPICLLPRGVQRLRIFETRYLNMVASLKQGDGFVVGLYLEQKRFFVPKWGTLVNILDFNTADDGILTIDVGASDLVSLSSFQYLDDGLLTANAHSRSHWSSDRDIISYKQNNQLDELSLLLKSLFVTNTELSSLYETHYFSYPKWVCARLLEIIPLSLTEKERVISQLTFSQVTQLLCTLCEIEEKNL